MTLQEAIEQIEEMQKEAARSSDKDARAHGYMMGLADVLSR